MLQFNMAYFHNGHFVAQQASTFHQSGVLSSKLSAGLFSFNFYVFRKVSLRERLSFALIRLKPISHMYCNPELI